MKGTEFAKWMDEVGVSTEEASDYFGCSVKNIYNWRSRGIADGKSDWVRKMMRRYQKSGPTSDTVLSITVSEERFELFNEASMKSGKLIKDWIIDELTEAANEALDGES